MRAGWVLLFCVAAAAETIESEDGAFAVDLPAGWQGQTRDGGSAKLALQVRAGEVTGSLRLTVVEGGYLTLLAHAHADRAYELKRARTKKAEVVVEPAPHLLCTGDAFVAVAYRRQACRTLRLRLTCAADAWETLRPGFFETAAAMRCTLPRWPGPPDGYDEKTKDGVTYVVARGVRAAGLKSVQRAVRDVVKAFEKFHGPVARPEDEPLLVFVHKKKEAALAVSAKAAKARHGYWADPYTRRLFAVPVPAPRSEALGDLYWKLTEVLFCERYGGPQPRWALNGECQLAWMRALTGRKAPAVEGSWLDRFGVPSHRLDALAALYAKDRRTVIDHGFAYVLYFRMGPTAAKTAYRDFLAGLAATGDPAGAERAHLFTLDLDELRDLAGRYLATKAKAVR